MANNSDICGICQEEFCPKQPDTALTACNHQFHFSCLYLWLDTQKLRSTTPSCPLCRQTLSHSDRPTDLDFDQSLTQYASLLVNFHRNHGSGWFMMLAIVMTSFVVLSAIYRKLIGIVDCMGTMWRHRHVVMFAMAFSLAFDYLLA